MKNLKLCFPPGDPEVAFIDEPVQEWLDKGLLQQLNVFAQAAISDVLERRAFEYSAAKMVGTLPANLQQIHELHNDWIAADATDEDAPEWLFIDAAEETPGVFSEAMVHVMGLLGRLHSWQGHWVASS